MGNSVFLRNPAETSRINKEQKNIDKKDIYEENSAFDKISGYDQGYTKKEYDDDTLFGSGDYSEIDYTVGDDNDNDIFA